MRAPAETGHFPIHQRLVPRSGAIKCPHLTADDGRAVATVGIFVGYAEYAGLVVGVGDASLAGATVGLNVMVRLGMLVGAGVKRGTGVAANEGRSVT